MLHSTTAVLNLSLGCILNEPLKIKTNLNEIGRKEFQLPSVNLEFEISNTSEQFFNEKQLAQYHGVRNKQTIDYNPRASLQTGILTLRYDDYSGEDLMFRLHGAVNFFTREFLAFLMGFLQRRRVIIFNIQTLPSKTNHLHLPGNGFSGELIDSVGHGQSIIDDDNLVLAITPAIQEFLSNSSDGRDQLIVLLRRNNDILNLPYIYERFDGYWRIIEQLGKGFLFSTTQDEHFHRLCILAGAPNGSKNLRNFVAGLFKYNISFEDDSIIKSFKYRNNSIHNYLSKLVIDDPELVNHFRFVAEATEKLIFTIFKIDPSMIKIRGYLVVVNRLIN
jgi:hypothetical protein